jgi:CRP-like cAMP-binding protein
MEKDVDRISSVLYEIKDDIRIFQLLDTEELKKLAPYLEIVNYPAHSVLFTEGDPGDFIGCVLSGKLDVKKETEFKGKQVILAVLERGSFVGELSLIDGQPRSATVEAHQDSEILILKRNSLDAYIQEYPSGGIKILKGIIRVLSLRLRKATERLTSIF